MLNDFAENIILQAKKASQDNKDTGSKSTSNFSLVDRLVQEYSDVTQIREAVMDIFIAGQNMSGSKLQHHLDRPLIRYEC